MITKLFKEDKKDIYSIDFWKGYEDFHGKNKRDLFLELIKKIPKKNQTIKEIYKEYEGKEGNNQHTTAILEYNMDIYTALDIKGKMNEYRMFSYDKSVNMWMFGNYYINEFYKLVEDIATKGLKYSIFLICNYVNKSSIDINIYEGNHRVQIFKLLEYKTIPTEIKFNGHSENIINKSDIKYKIDELKGK